MCPLVVWGDKSHLRFQGYDCSKPTNVRDLGFDLLSCHVSTSQPRIMKNLTIQILQKESHREIMGWRCTALVSRVASFCGNWDHATPLSDLSDHNIPKEISVEDCRSMIKHGQYTTPKGKKLVVSLNAINHLKYYIKGRQYPNDGQVSCQGEDIFFDGQRVPNMVIHEEIQLTLMPERFRGKFLISSSLKLSFSFLTPNSLNHSEST